MGSRRSRSAYAMALLAVAVMIGCGGKNDSPGPGGSTILGNVGAADTADVGRRRSVWLAWLGEHVLGVARAAYAQTRDSSLGGITVIVRGQGREVSDLTNDSGGFTVADAPTGDVEVIMRRGSCEASLPLGRVISSSFITLFDTDFSCPDGSNSGAISVAGIAERFVGVTREDPDDRADVRLCVREGDNDQLRSVDVRGAVFDDEDGRPIDFGDLDLHDLVEIDGDRSGPGRGFDFATISVRIADHDVRDDCVL